MGEIYSYHSQQLTIITHFKSSVISTSVDFVDLINYTILPASALLTLP